MRDVGYKVMDFIAFCLVFIVQCFSLCGVNATYNQDVVCVIDMGLDPVCKVVPSPSRRDDSQSRLPSYDPYIPRQFQVFYNCTDLECKQIYLTSLAQVTDPYLTLKGCFKSNAEYECQMLRYHHMKDVDKLLFLNSNIQNKTFYTADCLIYEDGGRVCHRKDDENTHTKLVDTATIVRPNKSNILSQDEFMCEQSLIGDVNCYTIPYVSFNGNLLPKESLIVNGRAKVLLKSENYVIPLQLNCFEKIGAWCAYSGIVIKSARRQGYRPPGGMIYTCFYAKGQLVCKRQMPHHRPSLQGRIYGGGGYPPHQGGGSEPQRRHKLYGGYVYNF